jgi:hypothetical protein
VTSKSKDQSIRLYNGRGHYNEWAFVYVQQQQAPGAVGAGQGRPVRAVNAVSPGPPDPASISPVAAEVAAIWPQWTWRTWRPGRRRFGGGGVTPIQPPSTPRGRF